MVSSWLLAGCSSAKKIEVGGICVLNSDCNSPLLCTDSKCHDACHASIDCPAGENCVKMNNATFCQLPAEADCSRTTCRSTYVCASDLRCRTPCQSVTDCADAQVCVTNVCADPNELENGQIPQKGPSAAADGGTDAQATATGGTGGGSGLGGTGGSSGGGGDAAAAGHGGANDAAGAGGDAGGSSGGAADAAGAGSGGTGGASGGAGGTATPDAGSPDLRPADTALASDAKTTTPDAATTASLDGGGSTVLTGCGKVTTQRYFCDDFESGLDNWHYATEGWGLTTATFQSPNNSVTDSPNGNYPACAQSEITMVSSVDLSGAVSPVVTFWHQLALSSKYGDYYYNNGNSTQDTVYIDISTDGGTTWTVLRSFGSKDNTSVWSFQQLSLASYIGKRIKLRLRLLDNNDTYQADGWYVDDIEIREIDVPAAGSPDAGLLNPVSVEPTGCAGVPVGTRYFCEDFESGDLSSSWLVASLGWNTESQTSQSPTHAATDSPGGNYSLGAKSEITMLSSVDLSSAVSPILSFWQRLTLAISYSSCIAGGGTDNVYVDISTDGGNNWAVLKNLNCLNNTSVWSFQQLSLSSFVGKKVKLRFRLEDSSDNVQADGWYVDDIKIRENEFVPAARDLALCTSQANGGACVASDTCGKSCGPDLLGSKSLTCPAGTYVEGTCIFPASLDYSCYKVGAAQVCAAGTKAGQACTATACQACGATTGTGYLDASGAAKQGFCVCSKGVWSCGTTTEWPCYPQTASATVPASCN